MHEALVPIRDGAGIVLGSFGLSRLPGRTDLLAVSDERVVVTEDGTYVYSIESPDGAGEVGVTPGDELFSFDDSSRRRGRLTPRQAEAVLAVLAEMFAA